MESMSKFITEYGAISAILGLGFFGFLVVVDRFRAFFFTYSLNSQAFLQKITGYIKADNIEEAIAHAAAHEQAPIAHVAKSVLSRADKDDDAIQQALDISLSESIPKVGKRMGYLTMVSNVATLIGLLGTIQGLIMSFEAVSFADPAQKQTLLAQGISTSMNTTAFGLGVAIPIMVVYAFLHAKQNAIMEDLMENSAKIVDVLSARNYRGFESAGMYDSSFNGSAAPQSSNAATPPEHKVS
ncbi:MAG: MotA/TolQ/ExbB proton channel family protein [Bdellovibrionota bacterium]|nr:adventurous gliding motility protein R [Pseudobdellovibrionaceae bacterium]|tara:strand:+ start:2620 stop:3342 length:723 start_codon:yes stop_codon:yes gene_type:complete